MQFEFDPRNINSYSSYDYPLTNRQNMAPTQSLIKYNDFAPRSWNEYITSDVYPTQNSVDKRRLPVDMQVAVANQLAANTPRAASSQPAANSYRENMVPSPQATSSPPTRGPNTRRNPTVIEDTSLHADDEIVINIDMEKILIWVFLFILIYLIFLGHTILKELSTLEKLFMNRVIESTTA